MFSLTTVFCIIITFGAYLLFRFLYLKYKSQLINIVILGSSLVISILLILKIPYAEYVPAQAMMSSLLGPATVALAVPLYRNKHLLKRYGLAIFLGVGVGSVVSMTTVLLITHTLGLPQEVVVSITPKSSSIPFAVEVARILGGDAAMAVAFVVATGTFGSFAGLMLLNLFKIHNPIARGLAMGTVSHGQGVAASFSEGEQQGSMAGVAMALSGIFTSVLAPFFILIFMK